jgi:cyclopropane-fatty-acyl-phospholipid synthase
VLLMCCYVLLQVTGITISQEQLKYARAKVKELGFEDRISILFCDYRKIPKEMEGTFDRRVSNVCLACV